MVIVNRPGFDGDSLVWCSGCVAGGRERSVVSGLELGRGDVAEVAVKAFGVVPVHPAEGRELDLLAGLPRSLSGPATELSTALAVTDARELRTGVRMGHESFEVGAARPAGHLERVEDHAGAHVGCDPPADDHPREGGDDETPERDTSPAGTI